jgi:ankyrin repeat protein
MLLACSRSKTGLVIYVQASGNGMLKIIEQLPKEDINSLNEFGYTPLHFAAMNGKALTCGWLLKNGADVYSLNNQNETALHMARDAKYLVTELVLEDFISNQVRGHLKIT